MAARASRAELRKHVAKLLNVLLHSAFAGWRERASEMRRQRLLLERVLSRFINLALGAAMAQWCAHVVDLKLQRARRASALKVIGRMQQRYIARGFDGWCSAVEGRDAHTQCHWAGSAWGLIIV